MKKYLYARILLFITFFFICFDNIPKILQLGFISSGMANKLSWYPLAILLGIYLYGRFLKSIKGCREECIVSIYLLLYVIIMLCSTIMGLIMYPYYEELLNGPVGQIEKIPQVVSFLDSWGINISVQHLTQVWLVGRVLKGVICNAIYTFGFAYVIYYFIKSNWGANLSVLQKGISYALYFMMAYSSVELFYLAGSDIATSILSTINPLLHPIAVDHNWWPPLLWKGQLRSIFPEPSHMGNYAAFVLPFLWMNILDKEKCSPKVVVLTFVFSFMIFMTRARTAVALTLGIMIVLGMLLIFIKNRNYFKRFIFIATITAMSFFASISFINIFINQSLSPDKIAIQNDSEISTIVKSADKYVDENLISLASDSQRSNRARYALLKAHFKTGWDHPFFGVGEGLGTAYAVDHFDDKDKQSKEVQMWIADYHQKGVLKYSLGSMNEFVGRFSANGIIGLIVFVIPFFYAMWKLMKRLRSTMGEIQLRILAVLVSLIGSFVAGCNGSLTLLYAPWVILAFAYAIIRSNEETNCESAQNRNIH